jgi:MYXO-CTERM domain-containing protein
MHRATWLVVWVSVVACLACQTEVSNPQSPAIGSTQQAIVNGTTDDQDTDVVFLAMTIDATGGQPGEKQIVSTCSAVAFTFDPNQTSSLFLATARHCPKLAEDDPEANLKAGYVFTVDNIFAFSDTTITDTSQPIKVVADAIYQNGDIAVLKLEKPINNPALMPPQSTLASQQLPTPVDLVGYGITDTNNTDSGVRRSAMASGTQLQDGGTDFGKLLIMNPTPGGLCSGDSGGKVKITINGKTYFIAVNSFVGRPQGSTATGPVGCTEAGVFNGAVRTDDPDQWQFFADFVSSQGGSVGVSGSAATGAAPGAATSGCSSAGEATSAAANLLLLALAALLSGRRRKAHA